MLGKSNQDKIILSFSLYGGWLLALLFHGPIIIELLGENMDRSRIFPLGVSVFHALGLIVSGFLIKNLGQAKSALIVITAVSFLGSVAFLTPYHFHWEFIMAMLGLLSGIYIGGWAFYVKGYFKESERFIGMGKVLIYTNILLMIFSVSTRTLGPTISLLGTLLLLILSLYIVSKISDTKEVEAKMQVREGLIDTSKRSEKPLVFLGFFILIITLNSGIMYSVVTPAFNNLSLVASYYFVLPYILAIFLILKKSREKSRIYALYSGLTLLGFSYILFILLDRSLSSYLWINGLMMGSLGIFDLYWWSEFGKFFDRYKNPAKIFGIGLGINVIGITLGGIAGTLLYRIGQSMVVSLGALSLIFLVIMILPLLNEQIQQIPKDGEGEDLTSSETLKPEEPGVSNREGAPGDILTPREEEIAELLAQAYTYVAIAEELYLSKNTVKYHVKNIYGKYEVSTKMDFIRKRGLENKEG